MSTIAVAESTQKRRPFVGGRRQPAKKRLFYLLLSFTTFCMLLLKVGVVQRTHCFMETHVWRNYSSKEIFWRETAKFINHRCHGSTKLTGIYLAEDIYPHAQASRVM